jgi:carbon-monoxide dehydrogenase medium subunit
MRTYIEQHQPQTLCEAATLLARTSPRTIVRAGGTWLDQAQTEPVAVVDLDQLGLAGVEQSGNALVIGAMATLQTLIAHPLLGRDGSCAGIKIVGISAQHEAAPELQARATVGGSVALAASASPLITAFLACAAEVTTYGLKSRRAPTVKDNDLTQTLALGGFLSYGAGLLEQGALITGLRIIVPSADTRSAFEADHTRGVCVAAQFAEKAGIAGNMRLAIGGVGATPLRLSRFEFGLEKKHINEFIDAELTAAIAPLIPPSDARFSADERKDAARALARRAVMSIA